MSNTKRRMRSRDLLQFQMCDDPQVSPDGREVAWVHTWINPDQNRYQSRIMVTDIATGATRHFSDGLQDSYPRWSPDGQQLAFLAARPASPGLANAPAPAVTALDGGIALILRKSGGLAYALTNLRGGVRAPTWSPDGTRIAFVTLLDPDVGLEQIADQPTLRISTRASIATWLSPAACAGNPMRSAFWGTTTTTWLS